MLKTRGDYILVVGSGRSRQMSCSTKNCSPKCEVAVDVDISTSLKVQVQDLFRVEFVSHLVQRWLDPFHGSRTEDLDYLWRPSANGNHTDQPPHE